MAQAPESFTIGPPENGRVASKTTRIQPPGGVSHINSDMVPQSMDIRQANRVLKPPGGMSSNISRKRNPQLPPTSRGRAALHLRHLKRSTEWRPTLNSEMNNPTTPHQEENH